MNDKHFSKLSPPPSSLSASTAAVTSGSGAKLSNQRGLRVNEYLSNFRGALNLEFSEEAVKPARMRDFVAYVGREIGVGASRKMGWGRFVVEDVAG